MAFVILRGSFLQFFPSFAERQWLIEKNKWFQGAFREFKEGAAARFRGAAHPASRLPLFGFLAAGGGDAPFRERQDGGFVHRGDRALRARIEFTHRLDRVAEEFDANGAQRFRRKNVNNSAADSKLAGEVHHFRASVADAAEVF